MAHLHLNILEIMEDIDTEGKSRSRAKVQEFKPRILNMNLKNASADQINHLKRLVGGDGMVPVREGMMNGQTFFQLLVDDEIISINEPQKIAVSKVVDVGDKSSLFGKTATN
jgi:hypothetical protein